MFQVWARACLRLVSHRSFGTGPAESWAGVTAGRRRALPRLERALLAPALPSDEAAVAAEAAVADEETLAAILGTRELLLATLLPAVGNPLDPFFSRSEQDLERMLGTRFVLLPGSRLFARARGLSSRRPLPPREEAAILLLAFGLESAAAALFAHGEATGTLGRRGRALRSAALVLVFLRDGGEREILPELFARRTREVLFLHTRAFAMTHGSPYVDEVPDGARRLLDLLGEKRRMVATLAALWARRPALGPTLGPLVRRLADAPGSPGPSRGAARFLRWWREHGRGTDEAVGFNLRGLLLLDEGRHAEATAEFERALEIDPALASAAFNLGIARLGAGEDGPDPAERLREAAEFADADGNRGLLLLGEFLERAERPGEAEEVYRRALASDPMDAEANLALGRLLVEDGRSAEAEEALQRALAARADDSDALVSLAVLHLEEGRPSSAIPLLRAALSASEGDRREEARYFLHVAFRDAEDHTRALETLDAVPDRFLRRNEQFLEEAALYLEERRRYDRAQRLHERLRELRARRGEF
jgi:tetratricopeptide (TPR) repeat protein